MIKAKNLFLLILLLMVCYVTNAQNTQYINAVDVGYENIFVQGNTAGWNLAKLGYERKYSNLTSYLKIDYNNRLNKRSYFAQADLYPKFSKSFFSHFSVGKSLSSNDIFPDMKLKGIVFHNITNTTIVGAGIQYLSFSFDDILIYNTELRWYIKNYLFLAQSHLQVRNGKLLGTAVITGRRYLTEHSYIFGKVAYGQSPQGLRIAPDFRNTLSSALALGGINFAFSKQFEVKGALKFQKFKLSNKRFQNRFGLSLSIRYRFSKL